MAQFEVFSPDGFAIDREETYPTFEVAKQKLKEMIESKIKSSEYRIQFLKEKLISYNLID